MTNINSLSLSLLSKKAQVQETILMLSAAVIFPFLVHLIPSVNNLPMGAILLPAFLAPFIAVFFFRIHVGLLTAIFGPILNFILTGSPKLEFLALYTTELVVFTLITFFLLKQEKTKMFSAPIAFVLAKGFSLLLLLIPSLYIYTGINPLQSLLNALPGIFLLLILNASLVKLNHKK